MATDDVLRALAMGPSRQVRTWSHHYVNGYNFHTHDYGKNKSTMNYGVCVESDGGVDYYGILDEILELVYHGSKAVYKTILFKCTWMDCDKGMNIHEQYKLVEVNHTRRYPKYDPFVLSYQVSQVYYAPYPSLKRDKVQWWAVFKTKARSEVDAPNDLDFLQEETTNVPIVLSAPDEIPDYDCDPDVDGEEFHVDEWQEGESESDSTDEIDEFVESEDEEDDGEDDGI